MITEPGCQWVEETIRRWNIAKKSYDNIQIHCLKICAEDSNFCPKHKLMYAVQVQKAASKPNVKEKSYF